MWYGHHNPARRHAWRSLGVAIALTLGSLIGTQSALGADPTTALGSGTVATVTHAVAGAGEAGTGAVATPTGAATDATDPAGAAQDATPPATASPPVAAVTKSEQSVVKPVATAAPVVNAVTKPVTAQAASAVNDVAKPVTDAAAPVTTAVSKPATAAAGTVVSDATGSALDAAVHVAEDATAPLPPAATSLAVPPTAAAKEPAAAAVGSAVSPLSVVGGVVQGVQNTVGRQLLAGPVVQPTVVEPAGYAGTADAPVRQPGGPEAVTATPPFLEAGALAPAPPLAGWAALTAALSLTAGARPGAAGASTRTPGPSAPHAPVEPSAPGGAAGSVGAAIALLLTLAGLLLLWVPPAVRRLRLASESPRLTPWVLIPERPG